MQVKAKKKEEKKPQKAMDAGARGRRLLQRREYRAKVSEFIPKELEDQFSYDKNGQLVYELDLKKIGSQIKNVGGKIFRKLTSGGVMKDYPTKKQHLDKIRSQGGDPSHWANSYEPEGEMIDEEGKSLFSTPGLDKLKKIKDFKDNADKVFKRKPIEKAHYEPEGEMIEANSAQMKAMHDAQMKKKEDDKVAEKKKNVKEGSAYGITRGSGKPSGAFKDYLDKKKKEKKKVDEACWKGYEKKGMKTMFGKRYPNCVKKTKKEEVQFEGKEEGGYISNAAKAEVRNQRRFGKKGSAEPTGRSGQGTSERARLAVQRGEEHKARRGVKKFKPIKTLKYNKVKKIGNFHKKEVSEDMKGMSQKSGDKRSTESGAGMTAQGVAKYNRRTGGNLKTAVTTPPSKLKPGSKAAKRRKSFCARSKSWTGPRGKAARRRWNCSYEPELPMIIDEKKKLFNTAPLSDRVSNWSKKINEGDSYVKSDRNKFGLPKDLKSVEKKSTTKKVTGVDYGIMAQSYEPQGDMVEMAKGKGAINPDVLKNNPNLDPTKPGDYIKLKRLSAKVAKINERKMTPSEKDRKEKYVKGMKKDKGGFTKRYGKDGKSVMYATATKMAMKEESCGKGEYYCYDDKKCKPIPEGMKVGKDGMLVKEAKYEKGASTYGKASIRNKRMFGKGGNAAPPEERGAAINVRRARHQERRYVKKGNKYHEPGKYRPEVHGVNKPEEERKGKNVKENVITDFIKNAAKVVNKTNKNQQIRNDRINQVLPGSAGYKKKPIKLNVEGSLQKNEQQIPNLPNLPGLGGGGGGTNAITAKAQTKSLGNYAKDMLKISTIPARFLLNIKSPQDPLSKFAAPTTPAGKVDSAIANYKRKLNMGEGSLHSWFKGSKSKDGKPGWVNVVTGGTCASDKPGEGTPKCVSSSKRASMTKAERLSASRRKKKADPGQQSKSGAAKPTYVATDSKKKK